MALNRRNTEYRSAIDAQEKNSILKSESSLNF